MMDPSVMFVYTGVRMDPSSMFVYTGVRMDSNLGWIQELCLYIPQ